MFGRRGVVIAPEELDDAWERRLCEAGLNVLGLHPDPKGPPAARVMCDFLQGENLSRLRRLERQGIAVEWEMHTMSWLLPRTLFDRHPQWFRMNEQGQRTPDCNLCTSSKEALETVSRAAAELAQLYRPSSGRYYFWLDDVTHSRCHCPKCRGLSGADQAMKAYNAILRGIRRVDPQGRGCYLAYHDTNSVPQQIRPDAGIFLEFAPMVRDFDHCIADPASEKNRRENASLRQLLEFFGTEGAQVLDYWLDNSLFSGWKKPPRPFNLCRRTLQADIRYYRQLGFDSVTSFGCYLGKEYTDLYPEPVEISEYGHYLLG